MDDPTGIEKLYAIMKRLRDPETGCPWDRVQTHRTLKKCSMEEVAELMDAIDAADDQNICEELGDLLMHVVLHSVVAEQRGAFTFRDVVREESEKMLRRHPHIFGDAHAENANDVVGLWDQVKKTEANHDRKSQMDGIPYHCPALLQAEKIQKRAAKAGFDWSSQEQILTKIREELSELENAFREQNDEHIDEELGDLLFSIANLTRFRKRLSAEELLAASSRKFAGRFRYIEQKFAENNLSLSKENSDKMEAYWSEAKKKNFVKTEKEIMEVIRTANGKNAVVPPGDYEIGETIFLPENTVLILDGCRLRMKDGVICRMFENAEGAHQNIHIDGCGTAILDGGLPNGLSEFTSKKNGLPHISENLTIFFHDVQNFSITGLTIRDQRWWSMAFMFCDHGKIEDLKFVLTRHSIDSRKQWRNQDGIDLRVGCSDIAIRNIEGETGDDMIALTALRSPAFEERYNIPGRSLEIHDITIENVRGITNQCALIRILSHFRQKIHHVTIRNVEEISIPGKNNQTQMAIRIGDRVPPYYGFNEENAQKTGDISDITIENLTTRALTAIITSDSVRNLTVKNIRLFGDAQSVWCSGGWLIDLQPFIYLPEREDEVKGSTLRIDVDNAVIADNIHFENVVCDSKPNLDVPLFRFNRTTFTNCEIKGLRYNNRLFADYRNCEGEPEFK